MLFHFRVPRTRPWDKYLKKLCAFLDKTEETAHLSALFNSAQKHRTVLVKLLDECAKENIIRSDEIIQALDDYLPTLEVLYEGVKACNVKLDPYIEFVWTSFMTMNVNSKSSSGDLAWERAMAYTTLGLVHYTKASEIHQQNRSKASKIKSEKEAEEREDYDPIFDEKPKDNKPKIFDDKNMIKEISVNLKKCASIWNFVSTKTHPVNCNAKAYDTIPETFRDLILCLSNCALTNAQEFMVQLCVQTNKSKDLTAKLAMGISKKLVESNNLIKNNLGNGNYENVRLDFRLYLTVRSSLYAAISHKYWSQKCTQDEKFGENVAHCKIAKKVLMGIKGFPEKEKDSTTTIQVLKKSISKQLASVNVLLKEAESENNNIYFQPVPKSVEAPESKWAMKLDDYNGYADL